MRTDPNMLQSRIRECMLADQSRLRGRLAQLERQSTARRPADAALRTLVEDIERSVARRAARQANTPTPSYPADLPVSQRRAEIAEAIRRHQVVIVCGQTGSGKTTQLPKICLEVGRGVAGLIGHTQPRRIAARSVAARIAQELGTPLGRAVGFKVRFTDHTSADGYLKVMTDGILLAETQGDRLLESYDTIIIDEAHERGLNIDFLIGYLKQLLARRPDLKVIITSATIDPDRFSRHFGGAPVIEVSGRTYPVEVRYRPLAAQNPDDPDTDLEQAILGAVDELARLEPGDVLVFLPGEREIRQTAEALRKHHPASTEILPLYARLSADEQMRIFQPHKGRRIVLATNVAETSLTVPGIRYVIDPGLARLSRYSPRTKVQRLPIEPISRASADQRAGRCGRTSPGVCIRLYSQEDYDQRPAFGEPEVLRTNLASVILQMKALRLGDVLKFPFLDPPDSRMVRDGYDTLLELGAVDEAGELTPTGHRLARLPVDPRLGRMILAAQEEASLSEVLIIAAALCIQDPRERPMEAQDRADEAHARFHDENSDFVALLNLWKFYHEHAAHLSRSKLRRLCQDNFLSFFRMREWHDTHQQLHTLVADMGFHPNAVAAAPENIHRAALAGLLSSVGAKADSFEYNGPHAMRFSIFPGSGLFKRGPKWVMAAELMRTTRLYARTCAKIEPAWIEVLAGHLVKRSYSEPAWDETSAQVVAFERVTLYGLEIVARRRVHYGPIEPRLCRELFIHHALVEGQYRGPGKGKAAFMRHNRALVEEIEALEAKLRRRDLLADAKARFAFFDARLPEEVYSGATFENWRRDAERGNPRLLFMSRQDLLAGEVGQDTPALFPDALPLGGASLPLTYRAEPGEPDDGVTVHVPAAALGQLDPAPLGWLVPGLLEEKVLALIKALPKDLRVNFVPAPQFAKRAAAALAARVAGGAVAIGPLPPLTEALTDVLLEQTGVHVPAEAWTDDALPEHLRMNMEVTDESGRILAAGRDLAALRRTLAASVEQAFARLPHERFNRDNIRDWDFGDLPESIEFSPATPPPSPPHLPGGEGRGEGGRSAKGAGPSAPTLSLRAYPALVDRSTHVALRLFPTLAGASFAMRAGLRRLFVLHISDDVTRRMEYRPGMDALAKYYAPLGPVKELHADLLALAAERTFLHDEPGAPADETRVIDGAWRLRTPEQFEQRLHARSPALDDALRQACEDAAAILAAHHAVALQLAECGASAPAIAPAVADIREQLAHLVPTGFLLSTPAPWLAHLARYLSAIQIRLGKLTVAGSGQRAAQREAKAGEEIGPMWRACLERAADLERQGRPPDPALVRFRWMIEELRVSLLAEQLGTSAPVSVQRLQRQWAQIVEGAPG